MQQQSQDTVTDVLSVIHAAYPDSWLMVAPSAEDDEFNVYSSDRKAIITTRNTVKFVIINRTTGEPLTSGEAATAMDAFAIIAEWLTLPERVEHVA